jgi:uncharacterized membrane protein
MLTPARIRKHPIHPMIIAFPIALWVFAFIAYLVHHGTNSTSWWIVAMYCTAAGLIGGVGAAIPGFIDFLTLSPSRTRTVATWHLILNATILILLAVAFFMRLAGNTSSTPLILTIIGIVLLFVSGWLGGSLVYVHSVGVASEPSEERQPPTEPFTPKQA